VSALEYELTISKKDCVAVYMIDAMDQQAMHAVRHFADDKNAQGPPDPDHLM
jgi:hypothetical protein